MFSRFRNLFSKAKDDSEVETTTDESYGNSENYAETSVYVNDTSEETSKLEGLNLLKSIVESEQQGQNNVVEPSDSKPPASLSEEVAELLRKRLSRDESQFSANEGVKDETDNHNKVSENIKENEETFHESKHNDEVNNLQIKSEDDSESIEKSSLEVSAEESVQISNNQEMENVYIQDDNEFVEESFQEVSTKESVQVSNNQELENASKQDDKEFIEEASQEVSAEESVQVSNNQEMKNASKQDDKEFVEESSQEVSAEESVQDSNNPDMENTSKQDNKEELTTNETVSSQKDSNENTEIIKEPIELFISENEEDVNATLNENSGTSESTNVAVPNDEEKISEATDLENVKETKDHNELFLNENEDVSKTNNEEEMISEATDLENVKETKEVNELFISENEEVSQAKESALQNEVSEPEKLNETKESIENEETSHAFTENNITQEENIFDTTENKVNQENSSEKEENSFNSNETKVTQENSTTDPNELKEIKPENSASLQDNENEYEKPTVLNNSQELNANHENNFDDSPNTDTQDSRENSPQFSESSKSLSQSSVKENLNHSTTQSTAQDFETNLCNNSSIVVEDIPSEITTPSPTVTDSTISGGSSNNSTLDSSSMHEVQDPSKIIVNPIDNNGLACNAITNKLSDIAEVAESLDAVIRDVQENVQTVEIESNPSPSDKKLGTLSSEDWHSRSTEDDSFATASEGNFTPHSLSSASFQTASGRTSSYISCDKNSFDASEADDSTYAFEMPELTSPLNMSFEGSEQSYLSAQPLNGEARSQDNEKTPTKLSENGSQSAHTLEEDQSSIADIEELHSESVTPTPEQHYDGYHVDSIPIESETELEVAGIADAPSLEILTEHTAMPLSRTPEVSASTSNACLNQNPLTTQLTVTEARDSNDQQDQQQNTNSNNNNNNKPNAAWRRSKYYENITKQTIKGFL